MVEPPSNPPHPSTTREHRAAGTRTMLDVFASWIGRRRSPAQDLADLHAGDTLLAVAFRVDRGTKQGKLILRTPGPVSWQPWPRGQVETLPELAHIKTVRDFQQSDPGWSLRGQYVVLEVESPTGIQVFAVTPTDVPLIQAAFA